MSMSHRTKSAPHSGAGANQIDGNSEITPTPELQVVAVKEPIVLLRLGVGRGGDFLDHAVAATCILYHPKILRASLRR